MKYRKLKAGEAFKPGDQMRLCTGKWAPVTKWFVDWKFKVLPGYEICYRRPLKPKNKKT